MPDLVNRSLEEIRIEERLQVLPARGKKPEGADSVPVSAQEARGDPNVPMPSPWLKSRPEVRRRRRVRVQACEARVVERTDHPSDISERRPLEPSLGEGAAGVSFEVDDREVLPGVQELAKVVVPVTPDAHGLGRAVADRTEPLPDLLLEFEGAV